MKQLFFLLIISSGLQAQTDSAKLNIRLSFMQKHIAYMGAELSTRNTLNDKRAYDSLSARIGSATKPDSVTIAGYPAGFVLRFFQSLMDEQTGTAYDYFRELVNGKTGFTGIISQLNTQVNGGNLTALWLRNRLQETIGNKEAVLTEKLKSGAEYLKTPIE